MAGTNAKVFIAVMLACLLVAGASAMNCGVVAQGLSACIPFVRDVGDMTPGCCAGVRRVNAEARSTADRQAACSCMKDMAGRIPHLDAGRAASIPRLCNVNVGYAISMNVDCSKVK